MANIDRIPVERTFNLNYPIQDIKNSIELLSSVNPKYVIDSKNDIFNTYTLALVSGILVIRPTIQLKGISANETSITLNCIFREGNTVTSNEIIDAYLNLLGKSLSGEEITSETIKANNKGCFTILIGITGFITTAIYYMIS